MNIVPSPQDRFCERFEAHIEPSKRVLYKYPFTTYPQSVDPYQYQQTIETIEAVAIHLPKDRLEDLFALLGNQQYLELKIREQVPAVKTAYENYKLLLKMCGGDEGGY
jgi:hypothetical protein